MPRFLNVKRDGLPPGADYIGRTAPRYGLRASKWANPFMVGRDGDRDEVIAMYEHWLHDERPDLMAAPAGAARLGSRVLVRAEAWPWRGVA
jgi:hypothetical protein